MPGRQPSLLQFQLASLRAKTAAVIEQEYGRVLDLSGGVDIERFDAITLKIENDGGNAYDAAAAFINADVTARLAAGGPAAYRYLHEMGHTMLRLKGRQWLRDCPEK